MKKECNPMKVMLKDKTRKAGKYEIRYRLFEITEERTYYSFEIEENSDEGFERERVDDVCDTREEAEKLYDKMYDGFVMPVSLHDIAEDYIAEKACV